MFPICSFHVLLSHSSSSSFFTSFHKALIQHHSSFGNRNKYYFETKHLRVVYTFHIKMQLAERKSQTGRQIFFHLCWWSKFEASSFICFLPLCSDLSLLIKNNKSRMLPRTASLLQTEHFILLKCSMPDPSVSLQAKQECSSPFTKSIIFTVSDVILFLFIVLSIAMLAYWNYFAKESTDF